MALGRERILIPRFFRFPPTLAVYDVAHSLPQGGVGGGFPFTEDETERHSSTSPDLLTSSIPVNQSINTARLISTSYYVTLLRFGYFDF